MPLGDVFKDKLGQLTQFYDQTLESEAFKTRFPMIYFPRARALSRKRRCRSRYQDASIASGASGPRVPEVQR